MRLQPRTPHPRLGNQRNRKRERCLHFEFDELAERIDLGRVGVKHQFVVNLKDHGALEAFALKAVVDADHGELHDVGGGALDGRVDRVPLGMAAYGLVPRIDVAQVAATSQKSFDVALGAGSRDLVVDVLFDSGIGGEVLLDDLLGFGALQAALLAKAKG